LNLNQKGYKILYCGSALLFHHESSTRNNEGNYDEINLKNIKTLMKKWDNYLFKSILNDKITQKKFFTDKKLKISFIKEGNSQKITNGIINGNEDYTLISNLSKEFNDMNYNIDLISNIEDNNFGKDVDIILSFDLRYDIENIISRNNIIKIIQLNNNYNSIDKDKKSNIPKYDIILTKNEQDSKEIKEDLNIKNVFYLNESKIPKNYYFTAEKLLYTISKVYNL
jgi:hypothetical protein